MRILIPILACHVTVWCMACLLLVGGCEKKQEFDPNVIADTNITKAGYEAMGLTEAEALEIFAEAIRNSIMPDPCPPETLTSYMLPYDLIKSWEDSGKIPDRLKRPCPPCPDSLSMQSQIIIDGTRMPPGYWISADTLCLWITGSDCKNMKVRIYGIEVDSVFILKE